MNYENLIGKKFNYITVISLSENRDNQGKILWNCICDCGKEMKVRSFCLKNGIKSCGCKTETKKKNMALNQKYAQYRRDVLKKGLEWNLSHDEFNELIQNRCYYCGSDPILWSPYLNKDGKIRKSYFNKMNNYNYMYETRIKITGVDRLYSNFGYSINNCVPCCTKCNIIKNAYTENDFLLQIKKIYEFKKLNNFEANKIDCETTNFIKKLKS
jgi:hypothetical protein